MKYISTRGEATGRSFADILLEGFAPDAGLYVPESYPKVSLETLASWRALDYAGLAQEILHLFWSEIPRRDLWLTCRDIYQPAHFPHGSDKISALDVTPTKSLHDDITILELSNGPTLTFDDLSMAFLSEIYRRGLVKTEKPVTVLGATTGDMGASCEAAFGDLPGCRVVMLSPKGRMSAWQAAALYSTKAKNVENLVLDTTFDECQHLVNDILRDRAFVRENAIVPANSILWARIAAQVVCYFYGYLRVAHTVGDQIVFAVPGGNFGNAFAGWVAQKMGLPILRLIVATNENDAMDVFLRTGTYAPRPGETVATSSPSMDIARAANFERFLFEMLDRDGARVRELMGELDGKGSFTLTPEEFAKVRRSRVSSGTSRHANRLEVIEWVHVNFGMFVDPHTADALYCGMYLHPVGVPTVCFETVDPVKFPRVIEAATGEKPEVPEGFEGLLEAPQKFTPWSGTTGDLKRRLLEGTK